MENEDTTEDFELAEQDETVEDQESSESDSSQATQALTADQELAKAKAEAAKYRRLFEKANKGIPAVADIQTSQTPTSEVDVDERILKAQGMNDKLLTELKVIAGLRGVSLIDAQSDDLFVALKEKTEKEERSKAASQGASRGSGSPKLKATLASPNLSREEHMKLVKG